MGVLAAIVNSKINKTNKKNSNIIDVYDALMQEYGWIPYEEFLKLPQELINALIEKINYRREQENKSMPRFRK